MPKGATLAGMDKPNVSVWEYAKAVVRHSFFSWERGERVANLINISIGAALGLLSYLGVKAATDLSPAFQFTIGLAVWFLTLVLLITPYRLWRDQALEIDRLTVRNRKQADLDEISDYRQKVVELRIDMVRDFAGKKRSTKEWEQIYKDLADEIAAKIEDFASHAEAVAYRIKGNVNRKVSKVPHQLYIDLCVHDIDYLRDFIIDYSRGKDR